MWDLPIHTTEANLRQGRREIEFETKRIEQFPDSRFQRARAPPRAPSKSEVPAPTFPSAHTSSPPWRAIKIRSSRFQIPGPQAPPQVHGSNSRISQFPTVLSPCTLSLRNSRVSTKRTRGVSLKVEAPQGWAPSEVPLAMACKFQNERGEPRPMSGLQGLQGL